MIQRTNESDESFNYRLLGRLQSDCDYFLGAGGGSERQLWAGNVKDQITKMKELWNGFPDDKKPEWLTMEQIEQYEKDMLAMNENNSGDIDKLPTIEELKDKKSS